MIKKVFAAFLALSFVFNVCAYQVLALNSGTKTLAATPAHNVDIDRLKTDLSMILENIEKTDPDKHAILEKLCREQFGSSLEITLADFESISDQYLYEIKRMDWLDLTPGCFSNWILSFLGAFALTPYVVYYAILSIYDGHQSCFLKYASWGISSLSLSLSSWTQYRICSEQHAQTPDQDVINGLQEDKDFLLRMALITLSAGFVFDVDCQENYLWYDNQR